MNTGPVSQAIRDFFATLEKAGNTLDLGTISTLYADSFMYGNPEGARVIEKKSFLAALPKRQELFRSLGYKMTRYESLEATALDEHYTMVRAHLLMRFQPEGQAQVEARFDSTFILYSRGKETTIVMHIEHEDLAPALQARGLLAR